MKRQALFELQYTHIGVIRNAAQTSSEPAGSRAAQDLRLALLLSNTSVGL